MTPATGAIRVVLVDDHPVVRAGLKALLATTGTIEVVDEAGSGADALRVVAHADPDVVLMDLQLGSGMDGVQTTRELLEDMPSRRVLIVTTYDTDADILRAIEAGACGYLLKDADAARLGEAVAAAARGETVLAPLVADRLVSRANSPRDEPTVRELEVLNLAADGLSNRAIARRLFVSEATVKTHLVHLYAKLDVDNRTAAVSTARARGLIR